LKIESQKVILSMLAVHIADGILQTEWWIAGFIVLGFLLIPASKLDMEKELPTLAILSAMFFAVTLIHIRIGGTSVHLLLNGLIGLILGWRAPIAILVGLVLQAALLGHGGLTTIGINSVIMSLPALVAYVITPRGWLRKSPFRVGFIVGMSVTFSSSALNGLVLLLGGIAPFQTIAMIILGAGSVLAIIEGLITGTILDFLVRANSPLVSSLRDESLQAESPTGQSPHSR
jgi:cobalt/nickel transport system permease protein